MNLREYRQLLSEFVAVKSISGDTGFVGEMSRAADWLNELLCGFGFEVNMFEGYGNPIILARYIHDDSLDTCLVYGHYDVVAAGNTEAWVLDPFVLSERDGRLYGRGVVDNKGQVLIHIMTVAELIREGRLGFNVIFVIEGDEETGSGRLDAFMREHSDLLRADVAMFSDGEMKDIPIIDAGFRGGFNATLTLTTSHTDLHSGLYGSAVPSAVHELATFIAGLRDKDNRVTITGFYDDVDVVDDTARREHARITYSLDEHVRVSGTKVMVTESGNDFFTQVGLRPAIQVTGIVAGHVGEGYRNSIPGSAMAKFNIRLTPEQSPERVVHVFKEYVRQTLPEYVDFRLEFADYFKGVSLEFDAPYTERVVVSLNESHGYSPVFKYCGGGLPVVAYIKEVLSIPVLSVSLANDDSNMHGVNENFNIDYIKKGFEFSNLFFAKEI